MEKYIHKVNYYETDKMGIVHHSNHIRWMEEARVDFLDQIGLSFRRMEDLGIFSPVLSVECEYKTPALFGDNIAIAVSIEEYKGLRLVVRYLMTKAGSGEIVAEGRTKHCFVDAAGKPIALRRSFPEVDAILKEAAE